MVLWIFFPALSNADFEFAAEKLTQISYTIARALLIPSQVIFINKKIFANVTLDENLEIFIIYVSILKTIEELIHFSQIAQRIALSWDKAYIKISAKYSNYSDFFLSDLIIWLPENTRIDENTIKLIDGK